MPYARGTASLASPADALSSDADSGDLITLGMRADHLRRLLHPEGVVTYVNTARVACSDTGGREPGRVDLEAIFRRVEDAVALGATGISLDVAATARPFHLEAVGSLLGSLRTHYPHLWIAGPSPAVIARLAAESGVSAQAALGRLQEAGLNTLAADEGETAGLPENLCVHRAAHSLGIPTVAELPVLARETASDRLARLQALRALQDETSGFRALSVTAPAGPSAFLSDELTAVEYLAALATARLTVPNIAHLESSWRAQGLKLLQVTLRFGANDAGSTHLEQTIAIPGPDTPTEEDLRRVIRDAGFSPVERSADYATQFLS